MDAGSSWRGGQRQALLLATGLSSGDDESIVVAQQRAPLAARARAAGLRVEPVRMPSEWHPASVRAMRALIRAHSPDIVHAHDSRGHGVALLALATLRKLERPPLVVTRRVVFQPRSVRLKYGGRVARFIAISRAVRDSMIAAGIDSGRISVVYSGVPSPSAMSGREWRKECHWPTNSVVCGVVGAMTSEKGLAAATDIAARLPADAAREARLVLIGGEAAGRSTMGGIEVHRPGFVEDVFAAMAGLDVLWHPSSSEGLGTAVIDAMALGVPPIAYSTGGLPELIEHGLNGLLVPPGNSAAFAAAAAALIRDRGLRVQLGAAGPVRAAQFDAAKMVQGTRAAYAEVLSGEP
ncbi:MAG TPA: glycosyltransferase family 4 protein [Gemmatimonadaceae bacterium]|nr:glycosyltransferase family 4 protein [Gemmatimonadaceae bacterium]